jgi:O-antigen/teichoic acid export membrane protein
MTVDISFGAIFDIAYSHASTVKVEGIAISIFRVVVSYARKGCHYPRSYFNTKSHRTPVYWRSGVAVCWLILEDSPVQFFSQFAVCQLVFLGSQFDMGLLSD